jgi:hypothetical protein
LLVKTSDNTRNSALGQMVFEHQLHPIDKLLVSQGGILYLLIWRLRKAGPEAFML